MYHKILQTFAELFFPEESRDALNVRKEEVYLPRTCSALQQDKLSW